MRRQYKIYLLTTFHGFCANVERYSGENGIHDMLKHILMKTRRKSQAPQSTRNRQNKSSFTNNVRITMLSNQLIKQM